MEINVKELEYCRLSIQYTADEEEINNKRDEVLKAFKSAPVPGFRKGKANLNSIKLYYRNQINDALKRALAEDAYHNTIFEKKYRPHGAPKINTAMLNGNTFVCEFEMQIRPDFELKQYRDFSVPKPHQDITSLEVGEKMLQDLRVRYGNSAPYQENDFVQSTDNLIVDYEGFVDGQKIDVLCSQGEMLTVGFSQLPNFDNSLMGMKIGETREFNILVPENGLPSFAGKTVNFKVTLNMGAKNTPCPLDDELAKKVGKETFQELKEVITNTANFRVAEQTRMKLMESIAAKLITDHEFRVPSWFIDSEARYLAASAKIDWDKLIQIDKDRLLQNAEKNVRLSLVLDKIRDVEPESQISDKDVFEIIKGNLLKTQKNVNIDDVIKEMNKTGYLQILFSRIKDEFVLDFISKTIKIVE